MAEHAFKAMGTTITLYGPDSDVFAAVTALTRGIFETEEQRFSRFRSDSELSRVNANAGTATPMSDRFAEVLSLAIEARDRTSGLFDPTVLRALEDSGYDRDFDDVADPWSPTEPPADLERHAVTGGVALIDGSVLLEEGVGLDFGGIAKGWTADRAADAASTMLGWAMIDAGGDMRLSGSGGIVVAIEDPLNDGEALTHLTLEDGALATSSTLRRRWGHDRHHIIDPRRGVPSRTGVVQATAWGATCVEAEVNSKWALLGGRSVLDHVGALLLMEGGEIITNLRCGTAPRKESA